MAWKIHSSDGTTTNVGDLGWTMRNADGTVLGGGGAANCELLFTDTSELVITDTGDTIEVCI